MTRLKSNFPRTLERLDDIAGALPPALLRDWMSGEQTRERAEAALQPYVVEGTVLSSDSAGLSRLMRTAGLIDVVGAISRMKQVVHAMGVSIGGRAPGGPWIADNTELFFPPSVPVESVLSLALEIHHRLPPDGVKVGFCIHRGTFYEIGGGLYGRDADRVELLAEEYASSGETLVTGEIRTALGRKDAFGMRRREDLNAFGEVYSVLSGPRSSHPVTFSPETMRYPLPFSVDLYDLLQKMSEPRHGELVKELIRGRWQQTRSVVIIEMGSGALAEPVEILECMALSAQAAVLLGDVVPEHAEVIENTRGLVLLTFEHSQDALSTTLELARTLAETGSVVRCGMDRGPILLVPDAEGRTSVLGSAVNIASKQAHELGRPGHLLLTNRAAGGLKLDPRCEPFQAQLSGVDVAGFVIPIGAAAGENEEDAGE